MEIIVLGGAGFIGTCLCSLLQKENIKFRIVDKVISKTFPKQSILGDVRDLDALKSIFSEHTILINLAAEHRDDVSPASLYDEVNVQGAINVCAAASYKKIKKIIFLSSVAVYGFSEDELDESSCILPFNDYGRTKYEAEKKYISWQSLDTLNRTLVIIRPSVVFGEQNKGNVYNLLSQIASGKFIMIGDGCNRKSMAYVGNLVAFIQFTFGFNPGLHIYNYIDKPDFTMNELVYKVNKLLGRSIKIKLRLPYATGLFIGMVFDLVAFTFSKKLNISAIRVKKFCVNSVYKSSIKNTGFLPPTSLEEALEKTIKYEFLEKHINEEVFYFD